jgi:acyl-CoA thioesterase
MSVEERLGLAPTEDPSRFTLHVHEGITTGGGALQGGAALGAAATGMASATGRPLIWATGHFLRHAAPGIHLDFEVEVGVRGHRVTQAQGLLRAGNQEVMRVVAAFGSRDIGVDHTFSERPHTPPPDACPPRPDVLLQGLEARRALGRDRGELDGSLGPGRSASWFRLPGGKRPIAPGEIAIISDCSALEVSDAMGFHCVNNSLDNTLRMAHAADTDWVLLDAQISSVIRGFATVNAHLWTEEGTLLAVFSQSLVVRRVDDAGQQIRSTKRFAAGEGAPR